MPTIYNVDARVFSYTYCAFYADNQGHYIFLYAHNDYKFLTDMVTNYWIHNRNIYFSIMRTCDIVIAR